LALLPFGHHLNRRGNKDTVVRRTKSGRMVGEGQPVATSDQFSPDYITARQRFRKVGADFGWALSAFPIGSVGPHDEELTIDIAVSPHHGNTKALVISSGLHGVEGYLGSAVQLAVLEGATSMNSGMRTVLLHGLNPYGFAWSRRFNENNVDPNRNFLLDGQPFVGCPAEYVAIDSLLNPRLPPARIDGFYLRALMAIVQHGMATLKQAVAGGQFEYPTGLFFGGKEPTKTQEILQQNLPSWIDRCSEVVHLDFHTGLGKWGSWKFLLDYPLNEPQRSWLIRWFGKETFAESNSEGVDFEASGSFGAWCVAQNPDQNYLYICAEFGTYSPLRVIAGLRAENQAHHWGQPGAAATIRAKSHLREIFSPANIKWRTRALTEGLYIVDQAMKGLRE
jgi:hypothetical protein